MKRFLFFSAMTILLPAAAAAQTPAVRLPAGNAVLDPPAAVVPSTGNPGQAVVTIPSVATAAAPTPVPVAKRTVEDDNCPAAEMPPMAVPHARATLAANEELVVVAIGSSSTQSWMSSNAAHSYPAILQDTLTRLLPKAHVAVINRGVGGQDAAEEVTRLDSDVIAAKPQIVIWQVGANGALRNIDPVVFSRMVSAGVDRLHAAGADVILMDNQQSPTIMAAPGHLVIDQALAGVASKTGSSLFARSALMDQWNRVGAQYTDFISSDGLHHNDRGYHCVAVSLADSIAAGLRTDKPGG